MGLLDPTPTRERTYTTSTPVDPNDMNVMQDVLIALLLENQPSEPRSLILPGSMWQDPNGSHTKLLSAAGAQIGWTLAASASKLTMPLPVQVGQRITGYAAWVHKDTDAGGTIATRIYRMRHSNVLLTEAAMGAGDSNNANAPGVIALAESGLTIDIADGFQYYMVLTPPNYVTPSADLIYGVELAVSFPV